MAKLPMYMYGIDKNTIGVKWYGIIYLFFCSFIHRIFCEHEYRKKGDSIDNIDFYFSEKRCVKCKKIKQTFNIKK